MTTIGLIPQGARGEDLGQKFEILVSTTGAVRNLAANLGNADYSYGFVLKALRPVLDALGPWRLVSHPESSLSYQAMRSRAEGRIPIHLSLQPTQNSFLTPDVPTILFPFWEFPTIPTRAFDYDSRQDWSQILSHADLIIAAANFTAETIREAGITVPTAVVPVPIRTDAFEIPDWDPAATHLIHCRHYRFGSQDVVNPLASTEESTRSESPQGPWWKRLLRRAYQSGNQFYQRRFLRWLSDEAAERLFHAKNRLIGRTITEPPLPPAAPLPLSGLVFTSLFNLGDRRKNPADLLTAFLLAFQNRPDVTLVIKLATNPKRETHEMKEFLHRYREFGIDHACQLIVITDYLDDEQLSTLYRATTFYLNTSKAEGSCLPLQEALAGGRPAIAPRHTALEDYIDSEVALVVASSLEPTFIPHDPDRRFETTWHRLDWQDLYQRLFEAASMVDSGSNRYREMARAARERMRAKYSAEEAEARFREALRCIGPEIHERRNAWSA